MLHVLFSDAVAPWGQAAAIVLAISMFIYILIGLALTAALMFAFAWIREKVELIKKVPSTVNSVNATLIAASHGQTPPAGANTNKIVQVVARVPEQVSHVEKVVDQGSDRVAQAVIEFRARTVMAQTVLKAFFLPGSMKPRPRTASEEAGLDFKSPGYRMLMEQAAPETVPEPGDGYKHSVGAEKLKAAGAGKAQELSPVVYEEAGQPDNAPVR